MSALVRVSAIGCSGFLTGLCVILPFLWQFIWVAPVPFLFVLFSQTHTATRKQALATGAVFGFVFNFTVSASAWSAFPLDWVGIPNPILSVLIIGGISLGSSLCMASGHIFLSWVIFELRTRGLSVFALLATLPLLWVAAEWMQAVLYSLYALGPTSTVNAFSQVASVALALGHSSNGIWIALARWGGMPLLSAFPVLVSACLALAIRSRDVRNVTLLWCACACAICILFLFASTFAMRAEDNARGTSPSWETADMLTVVVAKTDFPAQFIQTRDVLIARNDIVYSIANEIQSRNINPDVVLLPETVGNWLNLDGYARISKFFPTGTLLVHGKYGEGQPRTAQTYSHIIGGETFVTDKQYLMPYGEYQPYHFVGIERLFAPDAYATLHEHREYIGGTREEMGSARGVSIGVRLCSEVLAPQLYRSLAKKGAGLLVQSASIKLFEGTPVLQWVMRSAARIRAVENGLPLVQVMNGAPSAAFDCSGRVLAPVYETDDFKVYEIKRTDACRY